MSPLHDGSEGVRFPVENFGSCGAVCLSKGELIRSEKIM